jgi:predicted glycoside hydrolase/deacetylase ChbG (UPF0249 family)
MKRLIVNADDFGWSEAVTSGILQGHREGVITSTTLMTNLPGAAEALERARREAPNLAIGVHLNLLEGEPLAPRSDVAALLDGEGRLPSSLGALLRRLSFSAAAVAAAGKEMEAQVRWARDHGIEPSHLDGHKHVHLYPALRPAVIALARRHGIRAIRTTAELRLADLGQWLPWGVVDGLKQAIRAGIGRRWGLAGQKAAGEAGLATTDWFFGIRATGAVSAEIIVHLLKNAPEGTGELMVHPGLPDVKRPRGGRLTESRPRELAAVCDERVRRAAADLGWTWATYKDLSHD